MKSTSDNGPVRVNGAQVPYSEFMRTSNGGKRLAGSVWFVHTLHLMAAQTINFPCMRHGIFKVLVIHCTSPSPYPRFLGFTRPLPQVPGLHPALTPGSWASPGPHPRFPGFTRPLPQVPGLHPALTPGSRASPGHYVPNMAMSTPGSREGIWCSTGRMWSSTMCLSRMSSI